MTQAIHASCVIIGTKGLLIRGASGSGKSFLSEQLIELARAKGNLAELVSDDRVFLRVIDDRLVATAPTAIQGKLEVRGFGIGECVSFGGASVDLVVDLVSIDVIERLPDIAVNPVLIHSQSVPSIRCPANDSVASVRLVRWALRSLLPESADYI